MKISLLVLQHVDCEGLGYFYNPVVDAGFKIDIVKLYDGQKIPELSGYDALIVLGGYMNVYEEDEYPFLREEDTVIRQALSAGLPYLGICLGAQLLAKASNSKVYANSVKEIGFYDLRLTDAGTNDILFDGIESDLEVFQWHGDTFDLPADAELLASSKLCENQAFRYRNAYGLQFHLETTPHMIDQWSKLYADELKAFDGSVSINPYRAINTKFSAEKLINNFIKLVTYHHLAD